VENMMAPNKFFHPKNLKQTVSNDKKNYERTFVNSIRTVILIWRIFTGCNLTVLGIDLTATQIGPKMKTA